MEAPSRPQRWQTDVRQYANSLGQAIEDAVNVIFSGDIELKKGRTGTSAVFWRVDCKPSHPDDGSKEHLPSYLLIRRKHGMWLIDKAELEAVLGLWTWSFRKSPLSIIDNFAKAYALASSPDQVEQAKLDQKMWVSRELPRPISETIPLDSLALVTEDDTGYGEHTHNASPENARMRTLLSIPLATVQRGPTGLSDSHKDDYDTTILSLPTKNSLLAMCAEDRLTSFIDSVTAIISNLSDAQPMLQNDLHTPQAQNWQRDFRFANRHVDRIATAFAEAGLGSREEALISIIPSLRTKSILPLAEKVYDTVMSLAKDRRRSSRFTEWEDLLRWRYYNVSETGPSTWEVVAREFGELYRRAMRNAKDEIRDFGYHSILWMLSSLEDSDSMARPKDCYGWIAIQIALQKKDDMACQKLEAAKVSRSLVDGFETMTLLDAIRSDQIYPVGLLITERWKDDIRKPLAGAPQSLLSSAAQVGCIELVEDLLEEGRDINSTDELKGTPIYYASEAGHCIIIQQLLEAGAILPIHDTDGQTPPSRAGESGHEFAVKLLTEKALELDSADNEGRTPLWLVAEKGHEAMVKLLAEKGMELDSADNRGRTPLWLAAEKGREAMIKLLIEKGANIESKDRIGQTPLSRAADSGYESAVKLLLESGAEIEPKDYLLGRMPQGQAAQGGHEATVKLLLESGADVDSKDGEGRTSLSRAAGKGHDSVVRLLMEKGANKESKDEYNRTPLSWAIA